MRMIVKALPYMLPLVLTGLLTVSIRVGWYWLGPLILPATTYWHRYIGKFSRQQLYQEYIFFHHHPMMEFFRMACAFLFLAWNVIVAWWLGTHHLKWYELTLVIYSLLIFNSNFSITLAHDLMHSRWWLSRALGAVLLWINGFHYLETDHIYIHHIHVGTPADPASAYVNEPLFPYLFRSIRGRLNILYFQPRYYVRHKGVRLIFLNYLRLLMGIGILIAAYNFHIQVFIWLCAQFVCVPVIYETITYIQHYGLRRKQSEDGKYERIQIRHSWNCYYRLSAYLHFMMPVHSIHHLKDDRNIEHLEDPGPSFPFPFSRMVLLAYIPRLWFKHMNPVLKAHAS